MPALDDDAVAVDGTRLRLVEVAEVDSTNRVLVDAARSGIEPGLVLRTDHQTAGRGRRDRRWEAPPGSGLMMSLLLDPPDDPEHAPLLATAVGLAAVDACRALGAPIGLKWPNDLTVVTDEGGVPAKLAGILAESVVVGGDVIAVVVGIGLNLRRVPGRDAELGRAVAVLDDLVDARVDAGDLARDVLIACWPRLEAVAAGRWGEIRDDARAASTVLGRRVVVDIDGEQLRGEATDIDAGGRLVLRPDHGGPPVSLSVGDVVHVTID